MSASAYKIIAGLGNPGTKYARTRHNIGFEVVDALAEKLNISLDKNKFDSLYNQFRSPSGTVFIIKPQSYMNLSGIPIQKFASYYKVQMDDIVVVHDDMDLAFGQIKIVISRGHGGHNGVRSIIKEFGKKDCIRVRIGVNHPGTSRDVTGHVLGKFSPEEQKKMDQVIDTASNACLHILENGPTSAMNLFNTKS